MSRTWPAMGVTRQLRAYRRLVRLRRVELQREGEVVEEVAPGELGVDARSVDFGCRWRSRLAEEGGERLRLVPRWTAATLAMSSGPKSCVRKAASVNLVVERITPLIPGGVWPFRPGPTTSQEPAPCPVARLPM